MTDDRDQPEAEQRGKPSGDVVVRDREFEYVAETTTPGRLSRVLRLVAGIFSRSAWTTAVALLIALLVLGGWLLIRQADDGAPPDGGGETVEEIDPGPVDESPVEDAAAEPVDAANEPASEPAPAPPIVDDPAANDPAAAAAGTYWLSESSVRGPLESSPGVERFESAEGTIVIEPDGAVSGDFTYIYWSPATNDFPRARVIADNTIDPSGSATVTIGDDDGLVVEGLILVYFRIEPEGRDAYTNPGTEYTVTAKVDAQNGVVELTPPSDGGSTVTFEFLR